MHSTPQKLRVRHESYSHTLVVYPSGWPWRAIEHLFITWVLVDLGVETVLSSSGAGQSWAVILSRWDCWTPGDNSCSQNWKWPAPWKVLYRTPWQLRDPSFVVSDSFVHRKKWPDGRLASLVETDVILFLSKHKRKRERGWYSCPLDALCAFSLGLVWLTILSTMLLGPLHKHSLGHWNSTVEGLAQNVLKMYMEFDIHLYDRWEKQYIYIYIWNIYYTPYICYVYTWKHHM